MGLKQFSILCLVGLLSPLFMDTAYGLGHYQYLKAEKHLKKGQLGQYRKTVSKLDKHPLLPYLKARELRKSFYKTPIKELDLFFSEYQDQPTAKLLRRSWVWHLAAAQKWRLFLDYIGPTENLGLRCHRVTALASTNRQFDSLVEGQALWLMGVSLPKACDKVFANWTRHGFLNEDLIWQRLLIAQDKRQYKLVRFLQKKLSTPLKKQAKIVRSLWRRPTNILTDSRLVTLAPKARTLLIRKALKYQPNQYYNLANKNVLRGLNQEQLQSIEQVAFNYAAKHSGPETYVWYQQAQEKQLLDKHLEEEFLSGAVQNEDWPLYAHLYKMSKAHTKNTARWQYWQARALESLGSTTSKSQHFYQEASLERNFYGFLASQKLGVSASMNHDPTHVSATILQQIRMQAPVKRAMAFLDMGRISDARREWQYAFNKLDTDGREALAVIAGRLEWADRPIHTLAKQKSWHDLQLRFPLAHENLFDQAARNTRLSKNWIYGIARQESAFMYDAKSPVGATGLMQLMPSTAKSVSRKQRIKYSKRRLIDPEYNIKLGSLYLKQLLRRYKGNRVLATAAYNAGPGSVNRWLKQYSGDLDVWIERIPYDETREYVQRVLTYSTIYSYRLGQLQPMFDRNTLTAWTNNVRNNLEISKVTDRRKNKG
jgi:soluble lytic murein transglycosylase